MEPVSSFLSDAPSTIYKSVTQVENSLYLTSVSFTIFSIPQGGILPLRFEIYKCN
jgi:hypothetical protein